jgi:hypothetical protein
MPVGRSSKQSRTRKQDKGWGAETAREYSAAGRERMITWWSAGGVVSGNLCKRLFSVVLLLRLRMLIAVRRRSGQCGLFASPG